MKNKKSKAWFQVALILVALFIGALIFLEVLHRVTGLSIQSHEIGYLGMAIIYGVGGLFLLILKVFKIKKK